MEDTQLKYVTVGREVLKPLEEIVREYKASSSYNYIPGTDEEDAEEYYKERMGRILTSVDANLLVSEEERGLLRSVVYGMTSFMRRMEAADGLPDYFFGLNTNLIYFLSAFEIKSELSDEMFQESVRNGLITYVPSDEEVEARERYFADHDEESEEMGLGLDEDDYLMEELALAVRRAVDCCLAD